MKKIEIVSKEHPVLSQKSENIPISEIKSKKIQELIKAMKVALSKEDDGVGLAAPQVGYSINLFIVSNKIDPERFPKGLVFINPTIIKTSKEKEWVEEGCLSIRPWFGLVKRSTRVTIHGYNEEGKEITMGASGLLAQIFQHEVDHLHGKLFIEKAKDLIEVPQTKKEEQSKI